MNTTQLKRFAAEARNKLREGVKGRLIRLGFDLKTGEVPENLRPVAVENAGVWRGKAVSNNFMYNWNELYNHIKQIGIKQMIEEGAYTWFNRFVAIRVLAKNNLCDAVLQYVDSARTPRIVDEARTGRIPPMSDEQRQHLDELLDDDRLVTEQFAVLINAWVNNNPIISTCFDADSKHFIELLLPDDILSENGFISMLNDAFGDKPDDILNTKHEILNTSPEKLNTKYQILNTDDYRSPELIGWLYQFYISERKDEVFAKKGKYDADEIAPATQIFTPNWIVKYMVQNTVGRIYLDSLPESAKNEILNTKHFDWKYLVEPSDSEKSEILNTKHQILELEQLKVADLACGSGHILNECFDLLYELYIHEGYSRREAVTNIFEHNLTGIDIDLRAKQLATFALLLKACQRDSSFADAHCLPRVYDMPKVDRYTFRDTVGHFDCAYQIRLDFPNKVHEELDAAFTLMENADTLGSIMKFDISPKTREYLVKAVDCFHREPRYASSFRGLIDGYTIILALTEKYDAIVMNPPYMGGGNMNTVLSNYVKANYPAGKADLATVFVEMTPQHLANKGKYAFIIPPSWMFLSGFEALRREIINTQTINSLLHLSRGVFGADFGSSSAVISNEGTPNAKGNYFRLIERTFQEFDQKHLRMLFEKTLENHDFRYKFIDYSKDVEEIDYSDDGAIIYYPNIAQSNFDKIPGCPLGYWVGEKMIESFDSCKKATDYAFITSGLSTGDNNRFVRYWFEVNFSLVSFDYNNEKKYRRVRYVPYGRVGGTRRWYGLRTEVVVWENDGKEIIDAGTGTFRNPTTYFKGGLTWSGLCSNYTTFRAIPQGSIYDSNQNPLIAYKSVDLPYLLGFLNTKITITLLNLINPTFHVQVGDVCKLPVNITNSANLEEISSVVTNCISISKSDWDAHETSWDFQENEIVGLNTDLKYMDLVYGIYEGTGIDVDLAAPQLDSLEWRTDLIKAKWANKFTRLHDNEEELNRRFIEIYGLQDELTPDVPLNEVTILQQGEISIWKEGDPIPREVKNGSVEFSPIVWHDDVLMKQLISYAVGCMMGRYRLDRPGLAVAHPNPTREELAPYPLGGGTLLSPNLKTRTRVSSPPALSSTNNPFLERDKEINQAEAGNLPHWHQDGKLQFVTFRLADSLPKERRDELEAQRNSFIASHPEPWSEEVKRESQQTFSHRVEQWLDNGYGSCILKDESIAKIMEDCLYYYDGKQYIIHGYVIMPNHVHVLVETIEGYKLSEILKSWKGVSARRINEKLGKTGQVWMEESYDRLIRNEQHYNNVIDYINNNIRQCGVLYWNGGQECPPSQYFDIDDDAIIPLMPADCGFYDNATQRMSDFVRQVFGADTQTENLNYIERCLGKSIEQYFIKDFWKDHKKMYQNRPIYWLFSSKKGAFQVITYMHRMTPYTVERIRAKYLLPYIETLGSRIAELQSREDELSTAERKLLDSLQKQLEECREYHDRLAVVAERAIGFDLDDGVLHNYALYGDILAKIK